MTTPDKAIRTAIYAALTAPALLLAGKPVAVYDTIAPDTAVAPYIILDGQQNIGNDHKGAYGFLHYLALRVVDVSSGNFTGRSKTDDIANLLLPRVTPATPGGAIPLSVTGWKLMQVSAQTRDMPQSVAALKTVYQKIITLTLNVYQ